MSSATFTVSNDEYLEAQRSYIRSASPQSVWIRYVLLAVFVFSLITIGLTAHSVVPSDWPKLTGGAVFVVLLLCAPLLQKRALLKRYRVESASLSDVHVEIDENGYRSQVPGQGKGEVEWSAFTSYCETPRVLLLVRGYTFHPLPKRAFHEAELQQLTALVQARLPRLTRKLAKAQGR